MAGMRSEDGLERRQGMRMLIRLPEAGLPRPHGPWSRCTVRMVGRCGWFVIDFIGLCAVVIVVHMASPNPFGRTDRHVHHADARCCDGHFLGH